ncbi:hypothetical protein Golob_027266, partial [Gossypium lobatum]|nr:hypothetical protein [Gossypium lobatum]
VDLVPIVEEYTTLLRCPRIQVDRAYSRVAYVPTFLNKLMSITGMSEQWVAARMKQKRDSKCIPWKNLRDLILVHPDVRKRVDIFTLSIYGLVVFPKALGHVDEAALDLFDRLDKRVTPVLAILAETFRSLNACQRAGERRFIGCAKLLLVKETSGYTKTRRYHGREMDGDSPKSSREGCRVESPYRSRQFIPATQGLAQCEFSFKEYNYKKKVREISNAWNQTLQNEDTCCKSNDNS